MSEHRDNLNRLLDLVGMVCDEDATADELEELDVLAAPDHDACRRYLEYCRMHEMLRLDLCAYLATQAIYEQIGLRPNPRDRRRLDAREPATPDSIAPGISAALFRSASCYLSSGWPVAYLIATVVFAVGALVGSVTYVSHSVQVVRQSDSLPAPSSLFPSVVGRITEMVDCKWKEGTGDREVASGPWPVASEEKTHRSQVVLGDKFDLTSGLMEITYRTGAKVILQGPATYVVDAKDGGFLSVGKLTALVEKRGERREERGEKVASGQWLVTINNQQFSNPQSPVRRANTDRHRHRPRHGVRRRGGQERGHDIARFPRNRTHVCDRR